MLDQVTSPYTVDVDDYKHDLITGLSEAWQLAKNHVEEAQARQKNYDKSSNTHLQVGDRVMVHMPQEKKGQTWKLSRPYHGPYRILAVTPTNVEVQLVDCPDDKSLYLFSVFGLVTLSFPRYPGLVNMFINHLTAAGRRRIRLQDR